MNESNNHLRIWPKMDRNGEIEFICSWPRGLGFDEGDLLHVDLDSH